MSATIRRSGEEPCPRLRQLAGDFRPLVQQSCPLCQGTGPDCLVDQLYAVLARQAPRRLDDPSAT